MKSARPRSRLGRIIRFLFACLVLLMIGVGIEAATNWRCDLLGEIPPSSVRSAEHQAATSGIPGYLRPEDDTYLSYPEWYIVWSYQEKADFQQKSLPSGFPYFGALAQYWRSYCCISRLTGGKYPFNSGEQVMLVVIGSSFSAEYTLKGLYENTIGRLSEAASNHQKVEEDHYAYKVAREYADFVHIRPFYEFRFARHVKGLWADTSLFGAHPLRKWERKAFLTLDYTVEAFYCWLIEKATHATYGHEPSETYAWIDNATPALWQQPHIKNIKQVGPQAFIVDLPRYQEFTSISASMAQRGARFVEIAGNTRILVSVLAPDAWHFPTTPEARELFSTPVLIQTGHKRVVLVCEISALSGLLVQLSKGPATLEHIYDY